MCSGASGSFGGKTIITSPNPVAKIVDAVYNYHCSQDESEDKEHRPILSRQSPMKPAQLTHRAAVGRIIGITCRANTLGRIVPLIMTSH
jgi:hypothetical protein